MILHPVQTFPPARRSAIALTIALHLGLLLLWRVTSVPQASRPFSEDDATIQWIKDFRKPLPPPKVRPPVTAAATRSPAAAAPAPQAPATQEMVNEEAPVPAFAAPAAEAAPTESLAQRALRDVGKIDKELRRASPGGHITSAPASPASKLVAGIDKATRAPKLWEAPKIENVHDQGGYGRRIYKVTTGAGVYCIYQESNHAPDGLDVIKNGPKQKVMSCPREE